MQVCFIGVGSIAKRHIKNLMEIFSEKSEELQIDCVRRKDGKPLPEDVKAYINRVFLLGEKLPIKYDIIFVTNPTSRHLETLMAYREYAKSFFIEKPLCDIKSLSDTSILNDLLLTGQKAYVACPLRYCAVIQYLKKEVDFSKVNGIRCISSSYLPDWRPGTDYRDTYSAHKDMGGGVSIDLIHEWDYIQYLVGFPQKVLWMSGKKSGLEIDSEDIAVYIAEYENMMIELHLDYFGRKSQREVQIFTEEDTIVGDLISQKVFYLNENKEVDLSENRDAYQKKELNFAMEVFKGKEENTNDILNAVKTLKLTRGMTE